MKACLAALLLVVACDAAAKAPLAPEPEFDVTSVLLVSVAPSRATLTVGAKQQLITTVKDENGNVVTGLPVTYSSSNAAVYM